MSEERYQIIDKSVSEHCCFEFTIVDTARKTHIHEEGVTVCECFEKDQAELIAKALNRYSANES